MKNLIITHLLGILLLSTTMISCGGPEKIEEEYTFEMKDTLTESVVNFEPTKAGAIYNKSKNVLTVYFANFDNPENLHGICCNSTGSDDKKTISFIVYLDDDSNIDVEESFLNYSDKDMMSSLNMKDYTMTGKIDLEEHKVEGELKYTHNEDPNLYAKTTFKFNLNNE